MPSSSALPIEARQASWALLWERLLRPVPADPDDESGIDDFPDQTDDEQVA